jgi:flagellar basal body rod protein FlgF
MAVQSLNSVGGFSVTDNTGNASIIIDSNGNVTTPVLTVTQLSELGDVGNVTITGGSANYFLQTDGTGNLTWAAGGGNAAGSNTQVQFNNNGNFGGNSNFTFDYSNNILTTNATVSLPNQNVLEFGDNGVGNFVGFQGPANIASNVTWTLPNVVGNANTALTSDGTGNLYWTPVGTGNLLIIGRSGNTYVPTYGGMLNIVGRTGNIPVPV